MKKRCIFCTKEVDTKSDRYSQDHVPSKMLFPKGFNIKNPIKVPCHKECNNAFAKDEEWFRVFLVNLSLEKSFLANQLFETKIKDSIVNTPSIGIKVFNKMEIVDYYHSGIYLGKKTAMHLSVEDWDRYHNVLDKFAKGIFYHHLNTIPEDIGLKIRHKNINPNKISEQVLSSFNWNFENKSIFFYGISTIPTTKQSMILMSFYEGVYFLTFIASEENFINFENKHAHEN